ncbi:hypothetical protein FA95DRAFT_1586011 [Auriscalpium vulgare]|uniref:Uncharacterized protein n=1 Tax=Auriscalpium vulgare TaxID=40419 RepID=A0ACB8SBC9_9AGAM|nr:hypothetical protein FA95DRAFT_1586011 [Auriscalpium vulgare]
MQALVSSNDFLSQMLIAQLLEQDALTASSGQYAEQLLLEDALQASRGSVSEPSSPTLPDNNLPDVDEDFRMALELVARDAFLAGDAELAEKMQSDANTTFTMDYQYAQQLAAGEKKFAVDLEFARSLQKAQEVGGRRFNIDDESMMDAEGVLGREMMDELLAADPNSKGKGKGRVDTSVEPFGMSVDAEAPRSSPYDSCGICLEPFQPTYSPRSASESANSSSRLPFGLKMPCPEDHSYCISCLSMYIQHKLDPNGYGSGNADVVVFPILCPECPVDSWPEGIQQETAERVLGEKGMRLWHYQQLLDSIPKYYCPNPRCSARVQIDDAVEDPHAECPACTQHLCVPCRSIWHEDMTCEEYQALPLEDRSPDDLLVLQIVKAENWRRCPRCAYIVELSMGCNHVTCRCKAEFCFKCGSLWDKKRAKCTSDPSCLLWDEDMLLEQRERRRQQNDGPAAVAPREPVQRLQPAEAPPPYQPQQVHGNWQQFEWLSSPAVLNTCASKHPFTRQMIRTLTCRYCMTRVQSLRELQIHLALAAHPVFACCGRLFPNVNSYNSHRRSRRAHVHTINRA